MTIALPAKDDGIGAEVRILLAECRGPSYKSYTAEGAKSAMVLMHLVISNRLLKPGMYNASGASNVGGVLRGRGQFAGFGGYPNIDPSVNNRIESIVAVANNSHDKRAPNFEEFINNAVEVAGSAPIKDPSSGILCAWRTAGSGSPGENFILHKAVGGNEFYYIKKPE